MSEIMRCDSCHGKKKLIGLGSIVKDCPACKGVGYVAVEPIKVQSARKSKEAGVDFVKED